MCFGGGRRASAAAQQRARRGCARSRAPPPARGEDRQRGRGGKCEEGGCRAGRKHGAEDQTSAGKTRQIPAAAAAAGGPARSVLTGVERSQMHLIHPSWMLEHLGLLCSPLSITARIFLYCIPLEKKLCAKRDEKQVEDVGCWWWTQVDIYLKNTHFSSYECEFLYPVLMKFYLNAHNLSCYKLICCWHV